MDQRFGKKIIFLFSLFLIAANSPQDRSAEIKKIMEMDETKIEGSVEKPEIISIIKRKKHNFLEEKKEFKFEPKNILDNLEEFLERRSNDK